MVAAGTKPRHVGLLTACVMLATIMQALDTTIANVALPYMQGSLTATTDQINWVLTSYIVAAAIATPVTGFLEARLGRKRLFLVAVAGFTAASVLCGIAMSLLSILAAVALPSIAPMRVSTAPTAWPSCGSTATKS